MIEEDKKTNYMIIGRNSLLIYRLIGYEVEKLMHLYFFVPLFLELELNKSVVADSQKKSLLNDVS